VRADPAAARVHYRSAADAGDAHGLAEYGRCLLLGIGGDVQPARGEALLRRAAEASWPQALKELERYFFARGEALLHAAEGADDERLVEAVSRFRSSAELGHRRAAFMLAECLRHGTGTVIDVAQAVIWYRKSAAMLDAKVQLGDLFYFGQGVPPNLREALYWYEQAAVTHEDPYAMYSFGYCLLHGQGAACDLRAGAHWLRRAALQGEADAQYELGLAYFRGEGVKPSLRLAAKWLRAAAGMGHTGARAFLERMEIGSRVN
jgi:TPR repeat protein